MTKLETSIYHSVATRPLSQSDLEALLEQSRRRNLEGDITGLLLFAEGRFMQALEGPTAALGATIERIRIDDRHTDLRVVWSQQITTRLFPDWRMAFARPTAHDLDAFITLTEAATLRDVEPGASRFVMEQFARLHR